jgi:hypothetical protein
MVDFAQYCKTITDDDINAMFAYMKRLKPVNMQNSQRSARWTAGMGCTARLAVLGVSSLESTGIGTKLRRTFGERNGNFKHGRYTRETKVMRVTSEPLRSFNYAP